MSVLDTQPTTANFLSPLNFQFIIKKCPNINFYVQKIAVSGLDNPTTIYPNPLVVIPQTGDHIIFPPLVIDFKLTEDLSNYLEIYNWIREIGFPENTEEYKAIQDRPIWLGTGIKSDITVQILNSNQKPKFEFLFKDAHPTNLSGFTLTSVEMDVNFVTCQATFVYTNFVVNPII